MANELTVLMSLAFAKGTRNEEFAPGSFTVDVAGTDYVKQTMTCATTPGTQMDFGDVTTPGYLLIMNIDPATATNYVEIAQGTGVAELVRLGPQQGACFPLAADATAPFLVASATTVEVEYFLVEA